MVASVLYAAPSQSTQPMRLARDDSTFGSGIVLQIARANFRKHNQYVRSCFSENARQLLVYDVRHGWPPLCAFLGMDVPSAPFPNVLGVRRSGPGGQSLRCPTDGRRTACAGKRKAGRFRCRRGAVQTRCSPAALSSVVLAADVGGACPVPVQIWAWPQRGAATALSKLAVLLCASCTARRANLSCRTLHPAGCRWRLSPWQCAATSICRGTQVPSMLPGQWGGSLVEHSVYSELMSLGMVKVATRKPTPTSLSTHVHARTHTRPERALARESARTRARERERERKRERERERERGSKSLRERHTPTHSHAHADTETNLGPWDESLATQHLFASLRSHAGRRIHGSFARPCAFRLLSRAVGTTPVAHGSIRAAHACR